MQKTKKKFLTPSQKRKHMFLNDNIFKAVLLVSLPTILLSAVTGIFFFVDQVMFIQIAQSDYGQNGLYNNIDWFGTIDVNGVGESLFVKYNRIMNDNPDLDLEVVNVSSILRTSLSYASVSGFFIMAFIYLSSNGVNINFTKHLSTKNFEKTDEVLRNGFYNVLIASTIVMVLLLGLSNTLVTFQAGSRDSIQSHIPTGLNPDDSAIVKAMYEKQYDLIYDLTTTYFYIIACSAIFTVLTQTFSLCLISDGKKKMITTFSIAQVLLSIFIDFFLIYFAGLAVISAAISLLISYVCGFLAMIVYIIYLEKKDMTNVKISNAIKFNVSGSMILHINKTGLGSLVRNMSTSLTIVIQGAVISILSIKLLGGNSAHVQGLYAAVNPFSSLLWGVTTGFVQGARIITTYSYGANEKKRILHALGAMMFYITMFTISMTLLSYFVIGEPIVKLFGVGVSSVKDVNDAIRILTILNVQMIWPSLTVFPMMVMQFSGWFKSSVLIAATQFIIYCIIFMGFYALSLSIGDPIFFYWALLAAQIISAVVTMSWFTWWYKSIYIREDFNSKLGDSENRLAQKTLKRAMNRKSI